jgi:hypothetical protein
MLVFRWHVLQIHFTWTNTVSGGGIFFLGGGDLNWIVALIEKCTHFYNVFKFQLVVFFEKSTDIFSKILDEDIKIPSFIKLITIVNPLRKIFRLTHTESLFRKRVFFYIKFGFSKGKPWVFSRTNPCFCGVRSDFQSMPIFWQTPRFSLYAPIKWKTRSLVQNV